MRVTLIPPEEINSDLGVVNAARVSLAKKSTWYEDGSFTPPSKVLRQSDVKLLQYLAKHNHWTPFAHPSLYVSLFLNSKEEALFWYKRSNRAGFDFRTVTEARAGRIVDYTKGSLIGWLQNLPYLPIHIKDYVLYHLHVLYTKSVEAFIDASEIDNFSFNHRSTMIDEPFLIIKGYHDIVASTLLIKVPIAIARQIRTSQVGFSYSDYYVEGESFVYNEVSRRYVNDDPEFYSVDRWRVREGKGIKQGSTGYTDERAAEIMNTLEYNVNGLAECGYTQSVLMSVAPEQVRFLLPQSMYTEFYMTGSLHRWSQWLMLRLDKQAQEEVRYVASLAYQELTRGYPQFPEWYPMVAKMVGV